MDHHNSVYYPTSRLVWIDWMKTIAMYFIILGHMFLPYNEYIYVFNVPCFFIISGFLSKRESGNRLFWNKIAWNLIIPMFILFFIQQAFYFAKLYHAGTFQWDYLWQSPLLALCGMQGQQFAAGGLVQLWFVYTLVLCKIVLQYLPQKGEYITLFLINCLFLAIAVILHKSGHVYYSSFVNVLLAMPFFTIGYILRPFKQKLTDVSFWPIIIIMCVGLVLIWTCGTYNRTVMLYRCDYGSNLFLCLLGGVAGTAVIYACSLLLKSFLQGIIKTMGGGTLIILSLHPIAIDITYLFLLFTGINTRSLSGGCVRALLILLFFYPVILFIKRYIPIIYGKKRS